VIGREGRGPERPGPDYPPEWDLEPDGWDEEDTDVEPDWLTDVQGPEAPLPKVCGLPGCGCDGRWHP
jgi:hypothetical protein